jgi:hypothetical protein
MQVSHCEPRSGVATQETKSRGKQTGLGRFVENSLQQRYPVFSGLPREIRSQRRPPTPFLRHREQVAVRRAEGNPAPS